MRAARFLLALAVVLVVHLIAARLAPPFPRLVDLFLVLIVVNALDGNSLAGLLGGAAAGLVEDAVGGAYYGLHGIGGAVVGYSVARATQQLEVQQTSMVMIVFTLAAGVKIVVESALLFLLRDVPPSEPLWLGTSMLTAGLLGAVVVSGGKAMGRRLHSWRTSRVAKVRI